MILSIYYGTEMSLHCLDKTLEAKDTMFSTTLCSTLFFSDETKYRKQIMHAHTSVLLISGLDHSTKEKTFVLC